jgi:hypothetical protein
MPTQKLYGVFMAGGSYSKWVMRRNKRQALQDAKRVGGFVTAMALPGPGVWDRPTFLMCSDLIADYR